MGVFFNANSHTDSSTCNSKPHFSCSYQIFCNVWINVLLKDTGKGMQGWKGDEHWCVCLQFHCMDLACDTAGNGMEGWEGDEHGCVYLKLHCVDLACDIAP